MGGHYTQMIWKTSKEVGCGTASGSGSAAGGSMTGVSVYLVCRLQPTGQRSGIDTILAKCTQVVGDEEVGALPSDEGGGGLL